MSRVEDIINEAVNAIRAFSDPDRIILFGSRAGGYEREGSDIDIVVVDNRATSREKRMIREAVDNIRTLYEIDVVWLDTLSDELREEILNSGRAIYERGKEAFVCGQEV